MTHIFSELFKEKETKLYFQNDFFNRHSLNFRQIRTRRPKIKKQTVFFKFISLSFVTVIKVDNKSAVLLPTKQKWIPEPDSEFEYDSDDFDDGEDDEKGDTEMAESPKLVKVESETNPPKTKKIIKSKKSVTNDSSEEEETITLESSETIG